MARKSNKTASVSATATVAAAPVAAATPAATTTTTAAKKPLKAYNYTGMVSDVMTREGANGSFTVAKLTLDNGRTKRLKANAKQSEMLASLDQSQPIAVWGVYTGGNEISVRRFSTPATEAEIAAMRAAKAERVAVPAEG